MANELAVKVKVNLDTSQQALQQEFAKITAYAQKNPAKISVTIDKNSLKKSIEDAFGKGASQSLTNYSKNASAISKNYNKLIGNMQELYKWKQKLETTQAKTGDHSTEIARLNDNIKACEKNITDAKKALNGLFDYDKQPKYVQTLEKLNRALKVTEGTADDTKYKNSIAANTKEQIAYQQKLNGVVDEYVTHIKAAADAEAKMVDAQRKGDTQNELVYMNQMNDELDKMGKSVKDYQDVLNSQNAGTGFATSIKNAYAELQKQPAVIEASIAAIDKETIAYNNLASAQQKANDKDKSATEKAAIDEITDALERQTNAKVAYNKALNDNKPELAAYQYNEIAKTSDELQNAKDSADALGVEWRANKQYTDAWAESQRKLNSELGKMSATAADKQNTTDEQQRLALQKQITDAIKEETDVRLEWNKLKNEGKTNEASEANTRYINETTKTQKLLNEYQNQYNESAEKTVAVMNARAEAAERLKVANSKATAKAADEQDAEDAINKAKQEKEAIDSVVDAIERRTNAQVKWRKALSDNKPEIASYQDAEFQKYDKAFDDATEAADKLGIKWAQDKKVVDALAESQRKLGESNANAASKAADAQNTANLKAEKAAIDNITEAIERRTNAQIAQRKAISEDKTELATFQDSKINEATQDIKNATDAANQLGIKWWKNKEYLDAVTESQCKLNDETGKINANAVDKQNKADAAQKVNDIKAVTDAINEQTDAYIKYKKAYQAGNENETDAAAKKYWDADTKRNNLAKAYQTNYGENIKDEAAYKEAVAAATQKWTDAEAKLKDVKAKSDDSEQLKAEKAAIDSIIDATNKLTKAQVDLANAKKSGDTNAEKDATAEIQRQETALKSAKNAADQLGVAWQDDKRYMDAAYTAQQKLNASDMSTQTADEKAKAAAIREVISATNDMTNAEIAYNNAVRSGDTDNIAIRYEEIGKSVDKWNEATKAADSLGADWKNDADYLSALNNGIVKVSDSTNKLAQDNKLAQQTMQNYSTNAATAVNKLMNTYDGFLPDITDVKNAQQALEDAIVSSKGNEVSALEEVRKKYQNLSAEIAKATAEAQKQRNIATNKTGFDNLYTELSKFVKQNPNLTNDADLWGRIQKLEEATRSYSGALEDSRAEMANVKATAESLGLTTEGLAQKFSRLWKEHAQTAVVMAGLHLVQQGMQKVYQNVVEVDTAMTELKKVTDETSASYTQFTQRAAEQARELGTDISDYISTTADWARLGYNLADSEELARVSSLFANVGDGIESATQASSYLISTLKGFNLVADDAERVVDAINQIANTEPVSAQDISEILQRSAAALSASNTSFEETVALGTAMNSVLQNSATTGTALKTLSMYLRATKTELEDNGDEAEYCASTMSELRNSILGLTKGKVDIQIDEDSYKDVYQIMDEISKVYDELTDKEQAALLKLLGGKRNANAVQALIQQFDIARDSMEQMNHAANSAEEENSVYLDSIQGKLSQLSAAFQNLSQNLLDSNLIKFFADLGIGATDFANSLVKANALVPTLVSAVSAFGTVSNKDFGLLTPFTSTGITTFVSNLQDVSDVFTKFNVMRQTFAVDIDDFCSSITDTDGSLKAYLKSLNNTEASMGGYISSLVEAKVATLALQAGTILLNAGVSFLATFLINKAVGAWQKYQQGLKDSAEEAKRAASDFESAKTQMQEYIDSYNKLGDNSKWDASSMEQAKQLQEQIVDLFKDQGGQMDDILDKIDLQNGKYKEQKQLLTDINIQNAKNSSTELKTNLTNARKDLQSTIGFFDTKGDYIDLRGNSAKEAQYLSSKGVGNAYGNGNRADYYLGDFDYSKADDVAAAYDKVNEAIQTLVDNYSDEELAESELYSSLSSLKGQLEDNVTAYRNALDAYNDNQAVIEVGEALKTATIDSKEAFDNFIESLEKGKNYSEEYKQAIYDVASSAFPQYADAANEVADANNGMDESWKTDTPQRLANFLGSLSDSSSDLYAKTKALTSAYNDMYQNQRLSSDSIQALISAYPELINQMETENGVTTISKELLSDKFETIKASMVTTIESEIQATQTAINEAKQRIAIYQHEMQAITTLYSAIGMVASAAETGSAGAFHLIDNMSSEEYAAYEKYQAAQQGIADMEKTIKDANAQLADQKASLELLNSITLPNYAGATKGSSAANKGATQAAKENKKALEEQKKAAEKTKKELENYSKTLKAQGDAIIKVLDKRKDALEKEKDARDKAWDKEKEQLEEQQKLQDKVYDQQKEALEDKKKALQDANDEEDRAIKLAQLQDELAKAQSQRTKRVYQHDTGFEWQTDSSAVSDAQNNLDDQQRTWKREDAIDAVEKEIDAIEKLKDAYDDEVEAATDAIEKQKDAFDDSIDAQIDKIEEMKDKYQEVLDIIGMGWDEYQAMLDATAMANGMSLDSMGEYLVGFKENVITNLKQISDAEAEVQRLTDAISGIDTTSSNGGNTSPGGGFKGLSNTATQMSQNLQDLSAKIKESTDKISTLKVEEEALCEKLSNGNLTTSERVQTMTELGAVQSDIGDEEANLTDLAGQYVIALGEETDATDEYREAALNQLQTLTDGYNVSYDIIYNTLQKHLEDVQDTESGTAELYNSMSSTVDLFATNVITNFDNMSSNFDTFVEKMQTGANTIEETCKKAIENIKAMKQAADDDSDSSSGAHHAIGSREIKRSGRAIVDEEGPELIARQSMSNGRYTYLERGDQVLPASFSKNLWDMGSNPSEWFERQYSKFNRMDNSKAVYTGGTTVYSPSFTGDIVITNPISNSDDLARSLKQNLPASFMQAVGVRM